MMSNYRIIPNNQQLKEIGIDIPINNLEVKFLKDHKNGWYQIEAFYHAATYQYDIPKTFLKKT